MQGSVQPGDGGTVSVGIALATSLGMIELNRVLCPIDLSEASACAFDYVVDFARWDEPRLTVLHVVPPLPVMLGATGALPPPPADEDGLRSAALVRFVADPAPEGGPAAEVVLAKGTRRGRSWPGRRRRRRTSS